MFSTYFYNAIYIIRVIQFWKGDSENIYIINPNIHTYIPKTLVYEFQNPFNKNNKEWFDDSHSYDCVELLGLFHLSLIISNETSSSLWP